jgi:hypothetical protein
MAGLNLGASKIGDNYVLWESQSPYKEILETPNSTDLYIGLWKLKASVGIESIEIGEMDDFGIYCIEGVLPDFEFHNLSDESGRMQRYLEMVSIFSKEDYTNPAGRIALLIGIGKDGNRLADRDIVELHV